MSRTGSRRPMDLQVGADGIWGNHIASLEGAPCGGFVTPRATWQDQCLSNEATGFNAVGNDQCDRGISELWQFTKGLREHVERVQICAEQANQRSDPRVLAALVARVNSDMEANCVAMCKEHTAALSKQMATMIAEVRGLHSKAASEVGGSCTIASSGEMETPAEVTEPDVTAQEVVVHEATGDDLVGTRLGDAGDLQATSRSSTLTLPDASGIELLQHLNHRIGAIENSVAGLLTAFAERSEVETLRDRMQSMVPTIVEAVEERLRGLQERVNIVAHHVGCVKGKAIQHEVPLWSQASFGQPTEDSLLRERATLAAPFFVMSPSAKCGVEGAPAGFGRRRSSMPVMPALFNPDAGASIAGAEPSFSPVPATHERVSPCRQRPKSVGPHCSLHSGARPCGSHNRAAFGGEGAAGSTDVPAACCRCGGAVPAARNTSRCSIGLPSTRHLHRHQSASSMEAAPRLPEQPEPHGGRSPSPVTPALRLQRVATAPLPVARTGLAPPGRSRGLSPIPVAVAEVTSAAAGAAAAAQAPAAPAAPAAAGPRCIQASASWAGPPRLSPAREARQLSRDASGIGARLLASPRSSTGASRGRRGAGSPAAARSASPTSCQGEASSPPRQDPRRPQPLPQLQQHPQPQMTQQQQQPLRGRMPQQGCGSVSLGVGSKAVRPSLSPAPVAAWRRSTAPIAVQSVVPPTAEQGKLLSRA